MCTEAWNKVRYKETPDRAEKNRNSYLRRKYGIDPAEYEAMHSAQDGRCAICRVSDEEEIDRLYVDHCHTTGRVRALLCQACNVSLGKMRESPELLRAAAAYLEAHREEVTQVV